MSSANTPTIGPLDPRDASPLPLAPGDVVAGRYEVLRLLGSGGSAHVYAVRDRRIGDEIALKLLRGDVDVARSRREAEYARGSSSPRLLRAFDLVEADGLVFLTMELVPGGSLRDRLRRGPLPIDEVIRLGTEILQALAGLHALDVVHRDLKPGNLLLTVDGHVKLSDFGIARRWTDDESRLTVTGATLGTIDYLSPEQATGEDLDPRSDLYSFGVVLYEMLTGRLPFEATSQVAAIGMRLHRRPADVRALRPETPRWLAAMVARLLRTTREERYPSAEAVLRDLRRRRVRVALPRVRLVALLATLAIVAGIWWFTRPPAVTVAEAGDWGVHGRDASGRVIWTRNDTRAAQTTFVRRGETTEIAAILAPSATQVSDPLYHRRLTFLDPQLNRVLRSVSLPSAAGRFPEYSNRFGIHEVRAVDVDGDGFDEVLVAYAHHYLPWFLVLHDLRTGDSRIVFTASGHHHVAGMGDVDRDGRPELILVGLANRLGWYSGVAAVSVMRDGLSNDVLAHTPDRDDTSTNPGLVWYALCPPGKLDRSAVVVDAEARVIRLPYDGAPVELRFDGFIGDASLPPEERQRTRKRAYDHVREARRFIDSRYAAEALQQAETARQLATDAADPTLAEWAERVKGIALVHAGRFDEATKLFTAICDRSPAVSDAAYDAGTAFHVVGQLERAVEWYRRSVGREAQWWVGRTKYEALQGLVLALGELGRWDEALREIDTYAALYGSRREDYQYRQYVAWRSGGVSQATYDPDEGVDTYRFIALESELARGADPWQVLRKIEQERQIASETRRLVLLTKAEALRRTGESREAFPVAREAYRQLHAHQRTSALDHAHLKLAEERTRRIAAELGVRWEPTGTPR